jgi:serine/threonine protein kinase
MRCLNCHSCDLAADTEICPHCGTYLPGVWRDILPEGTLLRAGTYRLNYALGRGNFGITYQAAHSQLNCAVAIKEFYPQEYASRNLLNGHLHIPPKQSKTYQKGLQRFLEEGQLLVHLHHDHVVQVRDLFEENNTAYLVMDLIEGQTLTTLLAAQPQKQLPPERVRRLLEQLVAALQALHQRGIYHLDIKPDNLLITPKEELFLIDFGAAKQSSLPELTPKTRFFTESYAAPEIMAGGEIGAWTDIFEVGMLLYEMLTGQLPPRPEPSSRGRTLGGAATRRTLAYLGRNRPRTPRRKSPL